MSLTGKSQLIPNSLFDPLSNSIPQFVNSGNNVQLFAAQTRPKMINFDPNGKGGVIAYPSGLDFPTGAPTAAGSSRTAMYTVVYLLGGEMQVVELNTTDVWKVQQASFGVGNTTPVGNRASETNGIQVGSLCWENSIETIAEMPDDYVGLPLLRTDADRATSDEDGGYTFSMTLTALNRSHKWYVAHDDNRGGRPSWLSSFTSTGEEIVTSGGGRLNIYRWNGTLSAGVAQNIILAGNRAAGYLSTSCKMSIHFFKPVDDVISSSVMPDTDYTWVTLENEAQIYNDRDGTDGNVKYVWSDDEDAVAASPGSKTLIPPELVGGMFLQTSYEDRRLDTVDWISITTKYTTDLWVICDDDAGIDTALVDDGWADDSGNVDISGTSITGKDMSIYKKSFTASVADTIDGNDSPDGADDDSLAENLVTDQSWYFYYTYYRSWDGHEGPPSPVSAEFTTGGASEGIGKIICTLNGTNLDDCDELHLYAQLESVGTAYCLVPDMVVKNPGEGETTTVTFDYSIESLLAYGKQINWADRFKLPAFKYAELYDQAGRLLMWGQDSFIPTEGDKVTIRNYAFYTQYDGQLRLRVEFDPDNGSTPTEADIWKTLVVNNKAVGEIFYITQETSLWNYSGTVTVAYCVDAYLPQINLSGIAIDDFTIDGDDSIEYDHLAGHNDLIAYTSIVAQSSGDAVGLPVWQGWNPALYLMEEFNNARITSVHVEDVSVYITTDKPNVWRLAGAYTIGSWSYEVSPITFNRGCIAPLTTHSVRNSKARCLDQVGVIEIGPSSADCITDGLGARDLFYESYYGTNLKLAQGVFDQRNEQSILFPLTHVDSDNGDQDRVLVDQRNAVVCRENTNHTITAILAVIDDNGFQRLIFGDDNGYIGEFKKRNVYTDYIGGSGGYTCFVITGAQDLGSPKIKHVNKIKIFCSKSAEGGSTKEIKVGIFGSDGDIDPANIDFPGIYDGSVSLSATGQSINAEFITIGEEDFGRWNSIKADGTHLVIFIAGNSTTLPSKIGTMYLDVTEHNL